MAEGPRDAFEEGRRQAERVLVHRRERRALRRAARERLAAAPRAREVDTPAVAQLRAELGPPSDRVLLAEGDSWFDYPWTDVLKELRYRHGYDVEAVSHWGDTIEEIAYDPSQLDDLAEKLEDAIQDGKTPEAVLLSGGGNDVAGDDFALLLNHASSPSPGLNPQIVTGVVDGRVRNAYITVLSRITNYCTEQLGEPLPILIHGYDYAVPDGRGFWGGWWLLPGPWLEPGFLAKGYTNEAERLAIVKDLIDRFNAMLQGLPAVPGLGHVAYVNLRGTLSSGADYEDWWDNELHPTGKGFEAVADLFAAAIP